MREITMKALLSKSLNRVVSGLKTFRMAISYAKVTILQIAFIAFMLLAQVAQAQQAANCKISEVIKSMPDIKSVYDKFYQTYSYNSAERLPNILKFARKKDGWWVYEENGINGGQPFQQQLFWSYAKKAYQKLDFSEFKDGDNSNAEADFGYYMAGQLYDYSRIPYYGYNGWANDIVNEMQHEQNLGDTLLEALARAYGELGDIRGGRNYTHNYDATMKTLDDSIAYYLSNVDKELSTYKRLIEQNPDYKTMVGNVFIKYSHEYVNTWMELCMYGRPELAKKYLPAGLYGLTYIDYAKNYLSSCAQNAILITNGDGDTYPLWYVQEALDYRKDITVINYSLLGIPSFARIKQGGMGTSATINFSTPYAIYSSSKLDYVVYDYDKQYELIALKDAIEKLSSNVTQLNSVQATDNTPLKLASSDIYLHVTGKGSVLRKDLDAKDIITDTILIRPGMYFFKSDYMMMDLLARYGNERPFCFSYTSGFGDYLHMKPYLRLEGQVYRLVGSSIQTLNEAALHNEILYNNLMTKFTFALNDQHPEKTFTYYQLEAQNIRFVFINAATQCVGDKENDKAIKLLERMEKLIPHNKLAYRVFDIPALININIKLQQKNQVSALLKELSRLAEENTSNADYATPDGKYEINNCIFCLQYSVNICKAEGYDTEAKTLAAQIKKIQSKYNIPSTEE